MSSRKTKVSGRVLSKINKPKTFIGKHKLVFFLLLLLFLPLTSFVYNKYKDWDNAQLIKGLARDFPILVSEIEQATDLELEQKVDCSITTEKSSKGVRTCELSVGYIGDEDIKEIVTQTVFSSNFYSKTEEFKYNDGFYIFYRGKNSCDIGFNLKGDLSKNSFALTCITAVREANIDLTREVFLNK